MSARTNISNKSELFSSRSARKDEGKSPGKESSIADSPYGNPSHHSENNPLQLEHMLGYAGDYKKTVIAVPSNENLYIKGLGSFVSIENLSDPHDQKSLRGHDMPVSVLAISDTGSLIASSQIGTTHHKGYASPVFVWQLQDCSRLSILRGLTIKANILSFSPDEKFLCGCDDDCQLYIWDITTSEVVYGQKLLEPATVFRWTDMKKVSHNMSYEIVVGFGTVLQQGLFTYDNMRVQWSMKMRNFQMPVSGGIVRTFNCIDLSNDKIFIYIGTTAGEMMIYRRDTMVFRAIIPVCTIGLNDLITLPDGTVMCGGGDGSITKLSGHDMAWHVEQKSKVESAIRSVSLSANHAEFIAACSSGNIYRGLCNNLSSALVAVSHTSSITCVSFSRLPYGPTNSLLTFATGTTTGEIRLWDLTDYACLSLVKFPKSGEVSCLALIDDNNVLSGWRDGSIRCTDSQGRVSWSIPTAHRDGTNSIAAHIDPGLQYFVSGGADGAIRVWKFSNRELVTQYTEHRKGVSKVLIDRMSPNIVHSAGGDGSVLSYDLKAGRRMICHMSDSGSMLDMSQRLDSENELVTSDSSGRLLQWDIDARDPILAIHDPSKAAIRTCEVSKSGRFLAFSGDDQMLKVLDIRTNEVLAVGNSHSNSVKVVTWSPDEKQIISGGDDNCLCIWNFYLAGGQ